jgi:DNA-binding MarR family transcriptional regulator
MTDRRLAVDAWESLFRAQHEVFGEISIDFDDERLNQSEYDVLLTVTRAPGMTARLRDVTRLALVSQPSVSRLIDRMVARELVTKCGDPDDGRGSLVTATEKGARAFRELARRHAATVAERMSVLTDDELTRLRDLTAKLRGLDPGCVEAGDVAGFGPDAVVDGRDVA